MKNPHIFKDISWKVAIAGFLIGILGVPVFVLAELPNNSLPYPAELYAQCFDGIDNDWDGFVDLDDTDCPECDDKIDNDFDRLIDYDDPDCPSYYTHRKQPKKKSVIPAGGVIRAGGVDRKSVV